MFINPIGSILERSAEKSIYNILTAPTHERYETSLARTNHNFYGYMKKGVFKPNWNENFGKRPSNYHLLNNDLEENQIPNWLDFDLVLSQNKFGQFQILSQIAQINHIPLVNVEHTACMPYWPEEQKQQLREMRGNVNVFITDWSLESWGWQDRGDTVVIPHCVDTELFKPDERLIRKNHILEVANDYIGRDYVLNFSQFKRVVLDNKLPFRAVGDTKGLSVAPANINELVSEYKTSRIFINTHHISPIPTSLLEAMACGCAVVSCKTCAVPDYITHGVNGFMYSNDNEALEYLNLLLHDESLATKMGLAARKTIQEKCKVSRFVEQWSEVFNLARSMM
jgi:glycosyltransferase involved in cell wall biosynthesis